MNRYVRQEILPEIGVAGQARLAAARVFVVGAGGLGSTVLPLLAGAGVGRIDIVDPDHVEESNLHRQTLFRMSDLAQPKAEVAAQSLAALNPEGRFVAHVTRLDPENAADLTAQADLIVDAADSFATSYALSDLCFAVERPLISASVLARQGYVGGFCGGAPSLRAVFPDLPSRLGSCSDAGVMGPVVAMLGALQAQMALSVLLGLKPSPLGQLLSLDLARWHVSGFRFDGAPEPGAMPEILAPAQIDVGDLVIDLRGRDTVDPQPAPGQRVVFICTSGLRAWRAAKRCAALGHHRVAIVGDGQ
mgnify:FL=1